MGKIKTISLKCRKKRCGGDIFVVDETEISDGTVGVCDTCGRNYVAVLWDDGAISMEHHGVKDSQIKRHVG